MSKILFPLAGRVFVLLVCLLMTGVCLAQESPSSVLTARDLPPGPVYSPAEWEESEGIILNFNWMNVDTVYKMQLDHQVYIQVDDQAAEDIWLNFLNTNGIPLTNMHFIQIPATYAWMRDCGPWFIWDGDNELCIVNNSCWQGSYPDDDRFPKNFATQYGYPYYEPTPKIYSEGGNFLPAAHGVAFSTSKVYADNKEKTKAYTDSLFEDYLGIEHYHTAPQFTLFHHDTCGKPTNPETLIVVQWPEDYYKHVIGETVASYYATLESAWGRPYKILRLPMFPAPGIDFKPYMNCLVANKKVFVCITHTPDDAIALGIIGEAFPGYEIVGVDSHGSGWGASLHCATKLIMKRDIIRIYPLPPGDTEETVAGYPVTAEVIPPNGSALLPGYPVIRWTNTGSTPFNDVVMLPSGLPNEYEAEIPAQPQGTTLSFYIEARDDGGLSALYPLVAPDGMLNFQVREDSQAPELSRFVPTRSAAAGSWPPLIRTLCKDDMVNPEVLVEYAINGVPQPDVSLNREEMCYWYSGTLAGMASTGDLITYRLKATDNADSANLSYLPKLGEVFCPVAGPGESVGILDLSLFPYTMPFLLDTLGDLGIPHHHYRDWPADFSVHDVWFICLGVFPENHILSAAEANQIVTALGAGTYIYLEGGDTWCYDPEMTTLNPWFGVSKITRGHPITAVKGASGNFLDGLKLNYGHEVEDICIDYFNATSPAEIVMLSAANNGITVTNDTGGYRSIASSVPLGALVDRDWPDTRKEILSRYLAFFGMDGIRLTCHGTPRLGNRIELRIEGVPGETYLLLASKAEQYFPTDYGHLRLDPAYLWILRMGIIPAGGVESIALNVPGNPNKVGKDFHFQALVGQDMSPDSAELTNREIVTIVE